MEVTAREIADYVHGEVVGDENVKVSSVAKIESGKPGTLCFLANPKYEHYLYTCQASIVLINNSFEPKQPVSATLVKVENAYEAIASLLDMLNEMKTKRGCGRMKSILNWYHAAFSSRVGRGTYVGHFTHIGRKAKVGRRCYIYPQVYIGDGVEIGDNVILYPGVKIYKGCKIGDNCILHANVVIGSDGFGFAPTADGSYKKIPQTGIVIIEENCEIGANTVIDRATMGATFIGKGVKLDNLIQVAHNVVIGENTVIAAQTGIAGTTQIGKNCMIGGQVGFAGHLTIADKTNIAAQSGVIGSIKEEGKNWMGYPAIELRNYLKSYAMFKNSYKK